MKTIIVATDFSDNANNALRYASELARYCGAKIILYNAYRLPVHAANTLLSASAVDELLEINLKELQEQAEQISLEFGIEIEARSSFELVTDGLKALVIHENADLVVMGMHSNDWSDKVFGNTTTTVIRTAGYPILVIPENSAFQGIDKIMYAFDNDCIYYKNKLSMLREFANNFEAEVQVFHVETEDDQQEAVKAFRPQIDKTLEALNHSYKDLYEEDVIVGIEKGAQEFEADIVAMVPHRLTFWEGILNQSKTRAIALRTTIPLLVLPHPAVVNN